MTTAPRTQRRPDKDGVFDTIEALGGLSPMRWTDAQGVTHAVEGAEVHRGITPLWPRCGKGDVPANKAWTGSDPITCPHCTQTVQASQQ